MTSTLIQIPDSNLRQFKGHGPNFIALMPPDVTGLEVHIDWMIIVYLDKPQNKDVKEYLEKIEDAGIKKALKIVRHQDFEKKEFVYTFEELE